MLYLALAFLAGALGHFLLERLATPKYQSSPELTYRQELAAFLETYERDARAEPKENCRIPLGALADIALDYEQLTQDNERMYEMLFGQPIAFDIAGSNPRVDRASADIDFDDDQFAHRLVEAGLIPVPAPDESPTDDAVPIHGDGVTLKPGFPVDADASIAPATLPATESTETAIHLLGLDEPIILTRVGSPTPAKRAAKPAAKKVAKPAKKPAKKSTRSTRA